uniref:DNA topoisomerase (ATP-hydrolyzing) n=1 Tax=Myoviridae sp. ctwwN25 TaxID=2825209 RepID=A0A8S5PPU1_9CAUD|nr:MAG TPA: DNA topoisomerase 2 alpha [Myoviridae sp. ctwwN25]
MAETILNKSSNEQFKDDYTRYALYTTYKRVLSDMRDGLKPVQRRILWTMFHDTKAVTHTVKSAAVVGDVMKLYHPHGNCLGGLTQVYTVDGNITDIESVYKSGVKELEIKAFDPVSRKVVTAKATHFRIGTYADKIYKITATNGFSIQCTANHPILMNYFQWKNAEDVTGTDYFVQYNINGFRSTLKVDTIEIIELKEKIPMYDFTVSGYENMLIPIGDDHFVCVHNSGIYGTIKPMTNWFESKVPMVDNQGSFGNLEGDPASAERYTECKLSKFALECVIGELANTTKAVDWLDNYSNTCMEPEYLPVKVPLLLVEGSLGIGVGLRADIPAHNLGEVIDATIYLMHNPDGNVALVPDHCMACEIYDCDWEKISKTGFGHYKIRGKIDIETYKGKTALVIKSLPDMTFLDTIREKLEDLVDKKKIIQIENMYDECTPDTMRFVIVLKNGADPNYVREVIYKNTKVEQTLRINMETLYKFRPMRMSYKSYLLSFIDMRKLTKFRVYSNVLQDIQTKIHERDAYIKVLESGEIDNIIAMIRKQKKTDDSILIDYLIKKLKITDLQARYIINADLRRLSIGYLNKYKAEAVELEKQRKYYMDLIVDEKRIEAEIEAELLDIKARYGKPRMCKLIKGTDDLDIPKGEMVIAVTEKNFVRKVPGGTAIGSFRNDSVKSMIKIDNTDSIMIFDEQGRVFKLPVHKIPFTDRQSNGTDIRFLVKGLTANINCIIPESVIKELAKKGTHNNKHYLISITRSGLYKRMDLDDFINVPPSGLLYAKLDQPDFIKDIIIAHSNFNIIIYSDKKAVSVNVNDIPYLKRNTKGSRSIYNADVVDGLCVIDQTKSDIIVITESGKLNRIPIMSLPINPNKKGFNVIKLSSGDKINSIVSGNDSNIICIKTLKSYYEIPVAQLHVGSSVSGGEKLIAMKADQMIRCWIK